MNRRVLFLIGALVATALPAVVLIAATGSDEPTAATPTSPPAENPPSVKTLPEPTATSADVIVDPDVELPELLGQAAGMWATDWTRRTIELDELLLGIPIADPRDVIPPIDDPKFEGIAGADSWLNDREPGLSIQIEDEARFYPLRILTRHEIVNDVVGDVPVAVTYCPLCNTGVVFDRRFDGLVLRFGVSGLLRNSDLVMWDDESVSLWQQITGEGIVGKYAGERLQWIGSQLVRWADFKSSFPEGRVLSQDTGLGRTYGYNPYEFYSSRPRPYGFYSGEIDERYPALERVVGVSIDQDAKAYPFSVISGERVVNDVVGDESIVVVWGAEDTADALDAPLIAEAQAIGTGVAYSRRVNGEELTFSPLGDTTFLDDQTGTTWNILGLGISGPLAGERLEPVFHRNEFWFAWGAFFPDAAVYEGP